MTEELAASASRRYNLSATGSPSALTWVSVVVVVALAILLRIIPLSESHFWDETVFLQHAMMMVDGRTNYDEFHHRPPGLSALYAAGFLVSKHIYTAQVVQAIISGLSVLFAFLYGLRTVGRHGAVAAAVMFAFTPYFVDASHDLLSDMPTLTAILAAMWLFERGRTHSDLLAGALFALAISTRYTSAFFGLYFFLTALGSPGRWRSLPAFGLAAAIGLAPYLLWNWHNFGDWLYPLTQARRIVTEWTAPAPVEFYHQAFWSIFPIALLMLFAAGLVVTGMDLMRLWRGHPQLGEWINSLRRDSALRQTVVLLFWGFAFFAYMVTIPHKEVRYLLPLAVPVVMVAAVGFEGVFKWATAKGYGAALSCYLLAAVLFVPAFSPAFQRLGENWVDRSEGEPVTIGRMLGNIASTEDTVYAAHNFPVFAYYSGRKTMSLLPVQDSFEQVWAKYMSGPGFLVYYPPADLGETHSRNPRFQPDQAFIDAHPRSFQLIKRFRYASIYRYEPPPVTQ